MVFRPLPTHLLDGAVNSDGMSTPRALCGTWNPRRATAAIDAVTCVRCQDAALLAPA